MARRVVSVANVRAITPTQNQSLSELTFGQKQRFNYLSSIFDKEQTVIDIVKNIEPRGQNSWLQLNEKLRRIENADSASIVYQDSINQEVDLEKEYTSEDIITLIGGIRRRLNMPPHVGRLRRLCEDDFFSIFMIHDVVRNTTIGSRPLKSDVIAYKPVVRLIASE